MFAIKSSASVDLLILFSAWWFSISKVTFRRLCPPGISDFSNHETKFSCWEAHVCMV
jgi:hypothetical protein